MPKKIKLSRDEAIVFMGSMNAMPMMYALELKRQGYEVLYFVDVSQRNKLCRPENHFPEISYPYPSWIIETVLPSQIVVALFPKLFSIFFENKIRKSTEKKVGCFFLNGFFSSLVPYLIGDSKKAILSHGSDLDVWAYKSGSALLANSFSNRSVFRYLPKIISAVVIRKIIERQYAGMLSSDMVFYFPEGLNAAGDKVVHDLSVAGVKYIPRYDISFAPLQEKSRNFKKRKPILNIFSGVRFIFETFPDGNPGYGKGNDIIIDGIARFFLINPNIQVHFVEKGEDVGSAKEMCNALGLDGVVVWHKEMPFKKLLDLYSESDICFDQMGSHWIGAIGGYALWLGKPLIANTASLIKNNVWPEDNPVCSALTAEEVCNWLVRLQDDIFREKISIKSKIFVEKYMSPDKALNEAFYFC